jgi:hypothetical protein
LTLAEGIAEIGLFSGQKIESLADKERLRQEWGSRVHRCLDTGDYYGLLSLEHQLGGEYFTAEPVMSWALSSPWMAPPILSHEQRREVWRDLSFEVPVSGRVLRGSIDRLVVFKRASVHRHLLVLFRVTEKAASVDTLLEAYRYQMELAAWALRALDPKIASDELDGLLVNISARTIQTVPIRITGDIPIEELAHEATLIEQGKSGAPHPGAICRSCDFRQQCPEGLSAR